MAIRGIVFIILSFVLAVSSILGQVRISKFVRETPKSHNSHTLQVGMQKLRLVLELRHGFCVVSIVAKGAGQKASGKGETIRFFIVFLDREQVNLGGFLEETV